MKGNIMLTAKCMWPMNDIDLDFDRAIVMATATLPEILDENHWDQAGEPTAWRTAEGLYLIDGQPEPTLFLICHLPVAARPQAMAA